MAQISNERYEELQQVLEEQNGRSYTLEEAKEIGDGLLAFYALLLALEGEIGSEEKE